MPPGLQIVVGLLLFVAGMALPVEPLSLFVAGMALCLAGAVLMGWGTGVLLAIRRWRR